LVQRIQYCYKLGISSRVQQKFSMIALLICSDVFSSVRRRNVPPTLLATADEVIE
jgi:hypothetical protein